MSTGEASEAPIVLFCGCRHRSPQRDVCQFAPPHSCGGPNAGCRVCGGVIANPYDTIDAIEPPEIAVPPTPEVATADTTSDAFAQLMNSEGVHPVISGLMNALMESEGITGDELPDYRTRQE